MPHDPTQHADRGNGNGAAEETPATDAWRDVALLGREAAEYASHFVSARIDKIMVTLRNVGMYAAVGVMAMLVGGAVVVTAAVLLLVGLGGALSALLDARPWAGQLIVGLAVLGLMALGVLFGMMYMTRQSRKKTVRKYEQRKQQQRIDFGQDVHQRAQDAGK
jgi:hypothetical protein